MKQLNLTYLITPSHGYLKISKYDLQGIGIKEKDVCSKFSWYRNDNACYYLEEDCDMQKCIKLLKEKGYDINLKEKLVSKWDIN
tara:strand:+ start:353 stop:604 length:252 start_codon:yes stop_codon:yes gene_type:complete